MKLPSVEFMMLAARAISLLLALTVLAWAVRRWRRDVSRDAQRMFEQLDLVRAELLQLQDRVASQPLKSVVANQSQLQSHAATQYRPTPAATAYPDFESERRAVTDSRRSTSDVVKQKSLTNAAPRGYEVAARLARSGASVESLMNSCALSRHEAELLVRLHAGMKTLQPPVGGSANGSANKDQPAKENSSSRANANVNQLKDIGSRNKSIAKPASSLTNRPASSLRPATQQRVSLVG